MSSVVWYIEKEDLGDFYLSEIGCYKKLCL